MPAADYFSSAALLEPSESFWRRRGLGCLGVSEFAKSQRVVSRHEAVTGGRPLILGSSAS